MKIQHTKQMPRMFVLWLTNECVRIILRHLRYSADGTGIGIILFSRTQMLISANSITPHKIEQKDDTFGTNHPNLCCSSIISWLSAALWPVLNHLCPKWINQLLIYIYKECYAQKLQSTNIMGSILLCELIQSWFICSCKSNSNKFIQCKAVISRHAV